MSLQALVGRTRWSSPSSFAPIALAIALACACATPNESAGEKDAAERAAAAAAPVAAGPAIDLERYRMVDMTHAFTTDAQYWPTAGEGFVLKQDSYGMTEGGYFYSSNSFAAPEHGGTHL